MAAKEKELDQEFIDDVNAGYLIGKYAPELWELLVQSSGRSKALDGMKQGKGILDNEFDAAPALKLNSDKTKSTNGSSKGRKKRDIEPNR